MKKITLHQTFFLFICLNMGHNTINAMQQYAIIPYQSNILTIRIVEQPYFCSIDTKKTVERPLIFEDVKTHITPKTYSCTLCPKKLISPRGLSIHISRTHKNKEFKCLTCDGLFHDQSSLSRHTKTHGKKPYRCPLCNKIFNDLVNYTFHSQSHTKKITFLPLEDLPFDESSTENNFFTSR